MTLDAEPRAASPHVAHDAEIIELAKARDGFFGREVLYRDLLNALPAAIYTTDAEGRITFYNHAAVAFAGRRPVIGELWCVSWRLFTVDGAPLPHDQCPMAVALQEGRPVRGAEAIAERPDGTRVTFMPYPTPLRDETGRIVGAVNMLVDITARKAAEEQQRLLSKEADHRANNILTVVQSIVRVTRSDTAEGFREAISGRIEALARAHGLLAKSQWMGADLQKLVGEELAPFIGDEARVWMSGATLPMQPSAAQSMALIIHELATNAAKYGALSSASGRVDIRWRHNLEGELLLQWREDGGPAVRSPERRGVGSTVIERAVGQLGGVVAFDWAPTGLAVELRVPGESFTLQVRDE